MKPMMMRTDDETGNVNEDGKDDAGATNESEVCLIENANGVIIVQKTGEATAYSTVTFRKVDKKGFVFNASGTSDGLPRVIIQLC